MKHDEQCWKNQSIRDLGVGGPLASCTCGLDALLRVARAANVVSELALVQVSGVRADACVVLRKCLKELPEGLLE